MWEDFTPAPATTGHATPFVELESCVYQVNTLLFLMGSELVREFEESWEGGKGGTLTAGLVNLCHTTADALTLAFNETHRKWRQRARPNQEDAA